MVESEIREMDSATTSVMTAPKELRILCLGASLVAGFSSMGAVYHPFSHNIIKRLGVTMPGTKVDIEVDGVPGDRVTTGRFIERMKKQFAEGKERFDWAVVLGATNDVGVFAEVDDIMEALKETWGIPLGHKCKVLAVTVPRATIDEQYPQLVTRRNDLNQKIKDFNADGFHVFDLHDALPCDQNHIRLWDDAIHFTPAGYDFIGDRIGEALTEIIMSKRN